MKNKASEKLELYFKEGKITVNIYHDRGEVDETAPKIPKKPLYTKVLKKMSMLLNRKDCKQEKQLVL